MKLCWPTIAAGFIFFFLSGVTWVAGTAGEGVGGRITIADIVALGFVVLLLLSWNSVLRPNLKIPIEYTAYLPLLLVYLIGILFSEYPSRGMIEFTIHLFIFSISLILFNLYLRLPHENAVQILLQSLLWAGGLLAVIGLIDFLMWPNLIPGIGNGLIGTFRNTGQAGAFFGLFIALLVPGFFSRSIRLSWTNIALFVCICLALMFTFKRAAMIGLLSGLILLSASMMLSRRYSDKKLGLVMALGLSIGASLGYVALGWALENIEGVAWRFETKISLTAVEDFQDGFLRENIEATVDAFNMKPLLGVGMGNDAGVFTEKYEIHSTYLKLIATSGILGTAAYIVFMSTYLWTLIRSIGSGKNGSYLRYFIPLLVGLMVAWMYTYHLRKREFWILFFVTSLIAFYSRRDRQKAKNCLQSYR